MPGQLTTCFLQQTLKPAAPSQVEGEVLRASVTAWSRFEIGLSSLTQQHKSKNFQRHNLPYSRRPLNVLVRTFLEDILQDR